MKLTYDKEADVLAILLADAEVDETRNIAPGVEADYDSDGQVLSLEFLNAGKSTISKGLLSMSQTNYLEKSAKVTGLTLQRKLERYLARTWKSLASRNR